MKGARQCLELEIRAKGLITMCTIQNRLVDIIRSLGTMSWHLFFLLRVVVSGPDPIKADYNSFDSERTLITRV